MANLYVVATPIGNLEDITLRAIKILKSVDLILAEDTRVTKKLLNYYQIKTQIISYHQHSKITKVNHIINLLSGGKNLALVSDAGTPGISDPGNKLINELIESLNNKVSIIPIPGPSALTSGISISGFKMDRFLFLGFLPAKKKRTKFFDEILNSKYPIVFFDSPYRIVKTLREFSEKVKNKDQRFEVLVCRELTKKFETVYRGEIEEIIKELESKMVKGEFTVIINKIKIDWPEI